MRADDPKGDWHPYPAITFPAARAAPLWMQRRVNGEWQRREPTSAEVQDYIASEAW